MLSAGLRSTASLVHLYFTSLRCEHARRPLAAVHRARTRSTPGRHPIRRDRLALFRGIFLCLPCCPPTEPSGSCNRGSPPQGGPIVSNSLQREDAFELLDPLDIRINDHPIGMLMRVRLNASPGAIDTCRKVKHILLT